MYEWKYFVQWLFRQLRPPRIMYLWKILTSHQPIIKLISSPKPVNIINSRPKAVFFKWPSKIYKGLPKNVWTSVWLGPWLFVNVLQRFYANDCDAIYEIGGFFSCLSCNKLNEGLSGKVNEISSIRFKQYHNNIWIRFYFSSRRILYMK